MTAVGEPSRVRTAVHVGSSDVIISDNQIYTRGACDSNVTAIRLTEPAINLIVHDNLLRNCATGIVSDAAYSLVGEIVDPTTFVPGRGTVPLERRQSHRYRDWNLAWFRGAKPTGFSIIEFFDPETFRFKLKQPREMKISDRFEVFASSANWNIHDNTITGCAQPIMFNGHGSDTSLFRDNLIERGGTTNAMEAVVVTGKFKLIGNHVVGFEKEGATGTAR